MLDWLGIIPNPNAITPIQRMIAEQQMAAERDRLLRYDGAWAAYHGNHPKPLAVRRGQTDDNVIANKARVVVDKSVSFLMGSELTFELDDTTKARTPPEQHLDAVWGTPASMMARLHRLALNGAVTGDPWLKIQRADPNPPRLIVLDPAMVTAFPSDDDIEDVPKYIIQWNATDQRTGKPIVRRQEHLRADNGLSWVITDSQSRPDSNQWIQLRVELWPYDFPALAHCQNLPAPNEFYGVADLEADLIGLIYSRNFSLSNLARIIRLHAHPKTVTTGAAGVDVDISVDTMIMLRNPEATIKNLEMQSDLSGALNYDRRLDEALHEQSRTPSVSTGKVESLGPLSGVALGILYQPLVEKTATKRILYGELLAEVNRRLLLIAGLDAAKPTKINWPEMLPGDPLEERQTAQADLTMGVASKQTIAGKLGYDWNQEQDRIKAEDALALAKAQAMLPPGQAAPGQGQQPGQTPQQVQAVRTA